MIFELKNDILRDTQGVGCAELVRQWSRKPLGSNTLVGSSPTPTAMFNLFKKKKEPENLKEILSQFKELKENFEKISKELEDLKKEGKFSIKKVGMVRFNPFSEVGGNQSFSLALLDENNDGIVITSLYTREGNRVYGKPIKGGQSEYLLSEEEKEAIKIAKENEKRKSKFGTSTTGGGDFRSH